MYQDFCISPEKHKEQLETLHIPIKIITAEYGLPLPAKEYFSVANNPKELVMIA
jgi:hypothetical protein